MLTKITISKVDRTSEPFNLVILLKLVSRRWVADTAAGQNNHM